MSKKKKNTKQADTSNLLLYAIGTIVLIVLLVLSIGRMGIVGVSSDGFLSFLFGDFYLPIMLTLIFLCVYKLLFERKHPIRVNFFIGLWLVNIAIFLFLGVLKKDISTLSAIGGWMKEGIWHMADKTKYTYGAGMIGYFLYSALCQLFDRVGAILFLVLIFVIGVLLMIPFSFYRSSMDKVKESGEKYAEERRQYREEREREKEAERQRLQAEKEQRLAIERAKQAEIDRKKQEARDAYLHNPDLPVFIDK
ncbi:MAG: DNA translocase FtsK 4TM domain-containing protein, partial [Erysipelotrichaceae bacterium]|nr:DNA translocase FtsK 4TM domain-containing protein [Erysipelotrichaceae bacterium]